MSSSSTRIVEEQGKPARSRTWRLVRAAGNRITGTISDARGPVTGEVRGNVLHLRYRSAEGPSVEQWITLHPAATDGAQPDGVQAIRGDRGDGGVGD